jgi:hypothetical protein
MLLDMESTIMRLYHRQTLKHVPCRHNMKPHIKSNQRIRLFYRYPFPCHYNKNPQTKWAAHFYQRQTSVVTGVLVTTSNTCTPFNALCMYGSGPYSIRRKVSKLWYNNVVDIPLLELPRGQLIQGYSSHSCRWKNRNCLQNVM